MADRSPLIIGALSDFPEGSLREVQLDEECILVCRSGEQVYAVSAICPHRGAQLATGHLEDCTLRCPWHDWEFDVTSGQGITNPMSSLKSYPVDIRDGKIVLFPEKP